MKNIILSLFDVSGVWSDAYRELYPNYDVRQFDIQRNPSEDVRLQDWTPLRGRVRGVILQPPCTHFAVSGARWWKSKGQAALTEGLELIWECIRCIGETEPSWWVMENPVGRLKYYVGDWQYTFHPHEFAQYSDKPDEEAYTKQTCLWGNFNNPVKKSLPPALGSKIIRTSSRAKVLRSQTPQGFARAFAQSNP